MIVVIYFRIISANINALFYDSFSPFFISAESALADAECKGYETGCDACTYPTMPHVYESPEQRHQVCILLLHSFKTINISTRKP